MSTSMLDHEATDKHWADGSCRQKLQTTNRASYVAQSLQPDGAHGCKLLEMPLELRLMIYKHLLPNRQTIKAKTKARTDACGSYYRHLFIRDNYLRTDEDRVNIAILLTCRQVYHEIVPDLLYKGRKFVVDIWMHEEIRLGVQKVSWECIRAFPFDQIQCLEVRIFEPSYWNAATLFQIRQNIYGLVEFLARSPVLNQIVISPTATNWNNDSMRLGTTDWELVLQPFRLLRARVVSFHFSEANCMCCGCISGKYEATDAMMDLAVDVGNRMESSEPWTHAEQDGVIDQTRMMEMAVEGCLWRRVRAMFVQYRRPN
ncbi:hypothetical protein MMC17_007795 [Xylographa soralifera]|nr:hypothetical protein [Xylographa soralifera]